MLTGILSIYYRPYLWKSCNLGYRHAMAAILWYFAFIRPTFFLYWDTNPDLQSDR